MAQVMNPNFNVEAMELYVGTKSEGLGFIHCLQFARSSCFNGPFLFSVSTDVFTDEFWGRLDGVCNALDNMEARIYVDIQVTAYELKSVDV